MRVLAAALLAAAVLPLAPAPAQAAVDPAGFLCGTTVDPSLNGELTVHAGPLTLVDDAAPGPASGRVTCTAQKWDGGTHAGPELGHATSATGTGVVVLEPTPIPGVGFDLYYLCTRVDVDGGPTLYYDADNDEWSTSPLVGCSYFGPCPLSSAGDCHEPSGCDELLIDCLVCPFFLIAFPPEGDLSLPVVGPIWDCPPYGNVRPGDGP